jgi:hypothetical protein
MNNLHTSSGFYKMIDWAMENGIRIEKRGCKLFFFPRLKYLPMYSCHPSERAIHPLRRFIDMVIREERKVAA